MVILTRGAFYFYFIDHSYKPLIKHRNSMETKVKKSDLESIISWLMILEICQKPVTLSYFVGQGSFKLLPVLQSKFAGSRYS